MPFRARAVLQDLPLVDQGGPTLLVVDEFQDLNHAATAPIQVVAEHGAAVLAVGAGQPSALR